MVGRLEHLDVLVVAARRQRRAVREPEQAALREAAGLGSLRAGAAGAEAHRAVHRHVLGQRADLVDGAVDQRRHLAVGRIDDQRGPLVEQLGRRVHPEDVVAARVARRRLAIDEQLAQLGASGGGFLLRQLGPIGELLRTLQGRVGAEVPYAAQVGRAPRGPGRLRRLGPGGQRQRQQRGRGERGGGESGTTSLNHLLPPLSCSTCPAPRPADGPWINHRPSIMDPPPPARKTVVQHNRGRAPAGRALRPRRNVRG